MKYTNAKYIAAAVVTTSSIALTSMAGTCFAENKTKNAPVYLTAPATSIDFTISTGSAADTHAQGENAVYINQTSAASNEATVTNIVITNNVQSAPISVKKIKVTTVDSNYELVSYGGDFREHAINSKKYALAINSKNNATITTIDLVSDYEPDDDTVAANGTVTYGLTGKVSASSTAVSNAHIANVVVTVSE